MAMPEEKFVPLYASGEHGQLQCLFGAGARPPRWDQGVEFSVKSFDPGLVHPRFR